MQRIQQSSSRLVPVRASRSRSVPISRFASRVIGGAALLVLCACKGEPKTRGVPSATAAHEREAPPAAPDPRASWIQDEVTRARSASRSLSEAVTANHDALRPSYLALREAVAALEPIARTFSKMGLVVLAGPARSVDEAGGALASLDDALDREAWDEAREQAAQVERALQVIEQESLRATVTDGTTAAALSNAAYELGLAVLEATQTVPSREDAALADARGLLGGIERGSAPLARRGDVAAKGGDRLASASMSLRTALGTASDRLPPDRAALVQATAELGVAIRQVAKEAGISVPLPYAARWPTHANGWEEPVGAFTLPAARRAGASEDRALAEVGRLLFTDRRLSGRGDRSCATCHVPASWFTERRRAARSLDPRVRLRNTPTLLYVPVAAAQLWDGRLSAVSAQARGVMFSHAEMGSSPEQLSGRLRGVAEYAPLADDDGAISPERVARALAAFQEAVMVPAAAPIDAFARGDATALGAEERRGLDLFAGKARCARCHVPPLFGGSRPLDFATPVYAALGVPAARGQRTVDPDRGRGSASRLASDEHAFKTPTVRNIARTGPYFHNGAYATVRDVLAFYNEGGGRALGIDLPNQDPDVRPLHLSKDELYALERFVTRSLEDRVAPASLMKRGGR